MMPCKNQRQAKRNGTLKNVYTTIANTMLRVSQLDVTDMGILSVISFFRAARLQTWGGHGVPPLQLAMR